MIARAAVLVRRPAALLAARATRTAAVAAATTTHATAAGLRGTHALAAPRAAAERPSGGGEVPSRAITTRFNFDTYKLVRQLERQGLSRGQAVAIMRVINAFLVDSTLSLRAATLSTVELENDVYLFKAQLQELRNELQLLRQNDSANLKAETEAVMREIESLNQKFSELVASLKAEVAMDLNSHKADAREVGTDADLRIQEIHHKLVLRLSDIKTKIEAMKVEMTRMIVWMVIGLVGTLIFVDWVYPTPTAKEPTPTLPSTPLFPMFGMLPPPHTTGSASPPASSSTSVASRPSKTF